MALDHSRLGLENKFLENKSGRIFCVRQVYNLFYKILPTSLGTCKPTFYTFYALHLRWNSTMRRCFYHTGLGQKAVFHNFEIQIALIQYSGRSKHAWAFGETAENFSKSPIRPIGCELWSVWMNVNRVTLQHNKEVIMFIFYLVVLCVIFKSVWYERHFEYSCKWCSWTTENKRHSD